MKYVAIAAVVLILAVMCIAQEVEKAFKPKLPTGWTKISLSEKQKVDILDIAVKYHKQVRVLEKQIADLRVMERQEQVMVLNDEQKKLLTKLLLGEAK